MNDATQELLDIMRYRTYSPSDGQISVRLRGQSPLMASLFTAIALGFAAALVYPIMAMSFAPNRVPDAVYVLMGIIVLGPAIWSAVRRHRRIQAGYDDLIIDRNARAVSLPPNFGRRDRVLIPFDYITDVVPANELPRHTDANADADWVGKRSYTKRELTPIDEVHDTERRAEASFYEMRYGTVICWQTDEGEKRVEPIARASELRRMNALAHWITLQMERHAGFDEQNRASTQDATRKPGT